MASYTGVLKKTTKPYLQSLKDDLKARRDPTFFWPTGTQVYCGTQGSGKTISAVKHLHDLKRRYPAAIIVTNLELKYYKPIKFETQAQLRNIMRNAPKGAWGKYYIMFQSMEQLSWCLVDINNEFKGVMYLIDEIHTYFNALDSMNIPMFVFTEISQQRKQRKCIIGTSQLFMRMAKPLREQCDNLIICRTIMGFFTLQTAYDGMTVTQDYDGSLVGKAKKRGWFFHNRKIRNAFDTFQKVVSGAEQYEEIQRLQLTDKKGKVLKLK